jgi:hypothetical protein
MDAALLDLAALDFFFAGLEPVRFPFAVVVFFAFALAGVVFLVFAFAALGFFPFALVVFVFLAFTVFFAFAFVLTDLAVVDLRRRLDAAIPYPFCEPTSTGRIRPFPAQQSGMVISTPHDDKQNVAVLPGMAAKMSGV